MCNAWELMLKAFLIRKESSIDAITYRGKTRSISLSDCINKVFTSTTDKTKPNLNFIMSIRNRATHLIIPEFDYTLSPFFQQNVTNFNMFFQKHFPKYKLNSSVNAYVSINSLNIPESNALLMFDDVKQIKSYIEESKNIEGLTQNIDFYITKKKDEADMKLAIDKKANEKAKIVKVPKDVNSLYIYTFTNLIKIVNETIILNLGNAFGFNSHSLNKINKDYNAKENTLYSYPFEYGKNIIYKYSNHYFQFIVSNFLNDETFRNKYKKRGN